MKKLKDGFIMLKCVVFSIVLTYPLNNLLEGYWLGLLAGSMSMMMFSTYLEERTYKEVEHELRRLEDVSKSLNGYSN